MRCDQGPQLDSNHGSVCSCDVCGMSRGGPGYHTVHVVCKSTQNAHSVFPSDHVIVRNVQYMHNT